MKYAIIVSTLDPAGMNIYGRLLENYGFKRQDDCYMYGDICLYKIDRETVDCNQLDLPADVYIFATRHQSKTGMKTLSIHYPGNWSKAEMGGMDRTLNVAPSSLMKELFLELNILGKKLEGYDITLEATHHGPALDKPVLFIEIGATLEEWENVEAGKIIADTLMAVLTKKVHKTFEPCVGFGGTHYPSNFNKFLLRTEYGLANICPKYQLENLDIEMVLQAKSKCTEKVTKAAVDWKGLGKYKEKVLMLVEEAGLEVVKVKYSK